MPTISHQASTFEKRTARVRSKLFGTTERPRISVLRSNRFTYLQAIDDTKGVTIAFATDDRKTVGKVTKMARAVEAAKQLAAALKKQKVVAGVMDRGGYRYHGRIRAVAETLREAGIMI